MYVLHPSINKSLICLRDKTCLIHVLQKIFWILKLLEWCAHRRDGQRSRRLETLPLAFVWRMIRHLFPSGLLWFKYQCNSYLLPWKVLYSYNCFNIIKNCIFWKKIEDVNGLLQLIIVLCKRPQIYLSGGDKALKSVITNKTATSLCVYTHLQPTWCQSLFYCFFNIKHLDSEHAQNWVQLFCCWVLNIWYKKIA